MTGLLFSRMGATLIGIAAAVAFLAWSHSHAYQAGRTAECAATLSRSVEALRERSKVDDQIRTMDDHQLCLSLGGLPDECASLGM